MKKYNTHISLLIVVLFLFLMYSSITKTNKELFSNIQIDKKQNEKIEELKQILHL